jgi:ATP phosphoribosyltransferase regulatory subunit
MRGDPVAALMAVLAREAEMVTPALLQPADLFVEIAGEEFRKRLFLTDGNNGTTLCLRPEFTIPVCRDHLDAGRPSPAAYVYKGKTFRRRRAIGEPEFEQAGIEWLGHPDEMETDARLLALAYECAAAVGLTPRTRVGDAHVFAALTGAVGLSPTWQSRLVAAFGDPDRLAQALTRLARREPPDGLVARLAPALAAVDPAEARKVVEAIVAQRGGTAGRTVDDIAGRILEEAGTGAGQPEVVATVERFFAVRTPLAGAADALAAFARAEGIDLDGTLVDLARRTDALAGHGIDTAAITFDARFGRRLGYYTGFVFEMMDPAEPRAEVIAGGRYDKLIALLDPARSLPAVGFSVWLDRLPD